MGAEPWAATRVTNERRAARGLAPRKEMFSSLRFGTGGHPIDYEGDVGIT